MQLEDVLDKTCVVGVSYFDLAGELEKQTQYAGRVAKVDAELGITITLAHADPSVAAADFIVPPNLQAWFKAPPGHYRNAVSGVDLQNPDFLVTWNVFRTQDNTVEGQHAWWEWVPNTQAPSVGPGAQGH
jgi:hypothetical protein